MPRILPWAVEATPRKVATATTTPTPTRRRVPSPSDVVNSDLEDVDIAKSPVRTARQRERTPSTSPPPAPLSVEFMKDGYHADDIYRMVEDEFVATAKLYTQHIHYAEYVRLKKLAASRGKDALAGLHRGTDGKTPRSTTLKLRQEAEDNAEQRAQGQGDSDDDDEYLMDPQLAGLMTGGSRFREVLSHDLTVKISANKSNTRAAAGYSQSPHKEHKTFDIFGAGPSRNLSKPTSRSSLVVSEDDETDEDDLNAAPPPAVIPTRFSARAGSVPGAPTWDGVFGSQNQNFGIGARRALDHFRIDNIK
ncbi:uncharacterized protein K489DRAFT_402576 [Dissoconium aciculare CBS 342.82]|uniref:Uncharacterized protein n=1 Tax=Dissoconium aciculare CBS 342.82 TaxID=1314786 RepID=A0A6J3M124_9PEZI|nr:uncharacterized protein K489DRAFT_402576 [Dissoconium aciculare CBS 342.82]KAF1821721.1 hypothetical protein K489DRAFT_402576 [Dissoconium aciculare CBS 342.82]